MAQRSIKTFFKPVESVKSVKRNISSVIDSNTKETNGANDTNGTPDEKSKRIKLAHETGDRNIIDNGILTKIKLQAKATPALSDNIGVSWFRALENEFSKDYFKNLSKFLESERRSNQIYPPKDQVYSWTQMCSIKEVKVVLLGQDPYHNHGQAHGLAFSVLKGVAIPPSLLNMYKELSFDIPGFQQPNHGDLTGWSKQGVLLLNACLTVRAHNANSHANKGWEQFTDAVIKWLNSNLKGLVFLLWGSYAQKKGSFIDKKKHLVLQTTHPSPLSAHRGFMGCRHFSKTNDYLKKNDKVPIDWKDLP